MNASSWIPKGFLLAGAVNIGGILLFSKGLTNAYLKELDPQVFSTFGLVGILLWGLDGTGELGFWGRFRGVEG